MNSQLFKRLLLSNDVKAVPGIAKEKEILKDSMILEFLELKKKAAYYKKDLETAIITYIQDFLPELGNGKYGEDKE